MTSDEHIKRQRAVSKGLRQGGLKRNPRKCLFGAKEIKILGLIESNEGVRPDPEKVKSVTEFSIPKSIRDERSFSDYGLITVVLAKTFVSKPGHPQELLKADAIFIWGGAQQDTFDVLPEALTTDPVLGLYDETAPTELHTDASGYGIGAVLVQISDGEEKGIAYTSRILTKAKRNYSTTERDCLAVIWAYAN